jgi:hypothetical protein
MAARKLRRAQTGESQSAFMTESPSANQITKSGSFLGRMGDGLVLTVSHFGRPSGTAPDGTPLSPIKKRTFPKRSFDINANGSDV